MQELGKRLRELRLNRNLTQEQVASLIGTSKQQISTIELGMRYPSIPQLRRLASEFKVSTDFLLGLERGSSIDVTGLSGKQLSIVQSVVDSFREP